jgi:hypothetical protein
MANDFIPCHCSTTQKIGDLYCGRPAIVFYRLLPRPPFLVRQLVVGRCAEHTQVINLDYMRLVSYEEAWEAWTLECAEEIHNI